jgi:hypothetical protein
MWLFNMVRREGPAREVEVERIRQGLDLFDNYLWISDLQHLVNPSVTIQLGQGVMNQFGTGVHEPSNQEQSTAHNYLTKAHATCCRCVCNANAMGTDWNNRMGCYAYAPAPALHLCGGNP